MSSQQERDADPLIGCRVITLHSKTDDWTITAKCARRWGIVGTITESSNSHGKRRSSMSRIITSTHVNDD